MAFIKYLRYHERKSGKQDSPIDSRAGLSKVSRALRTEDRPARKRLD